MSEKDKTKAMFQWLEDKGLAAWTVAAAFSVGYHDKTVHIYETHPDISKEDFLKETGLEEEEDEWAEDEDGEEPAYASVYGDYYHILACLLIIYNIHFKGRLVYRDEDCSEVFSIEKLPVQNCDNGHGFLYLHTGRYLVAPEKRTVLTAKGTPGEGYPLNERGEAYYPVHGPFELKKGGSIVYGLVYKEASSFFRQLMLEYVQFQETELPEEHLRDLIKDIDAAAFDDELLNDGLIERISSSGKANNFLDFIIVCASLISFHFYRDESWNDADLFAIFDYFLEPLLCDVFPEDNNLEEAVSFFAKQHGRKKEILEATAQTASEMQEMKLVPIWSIEGLTWRGESDEPEDE